ncbi:ABC transporter ATP-binding protein [Lysinibacter sp. HNR]|uniref:ABC transporter ATP-binding protein n=1 Tax=Lysinibacter sp. HNR TaxID=3031408 RepID=UPI0024347DF3|nr:ABC transporter ATP-binding protein [Lysinibacter sp. HNR]WGD37221.1 ABC transporter ATP-binding protein [Lysinibacter sp. HNR]
MAQLSISHVSKTFGSTRVLEPVNLNVGDGQFCCMLGSSGSGKSTLLRIIAGLEEPDEGTILVGSKDITRLSVEKRNIGFVFQNYALFPHLSVLANVAYGLQARRTLRKTAKKKAEDMLKLVGLGDFGGRSPGQLSGGQQQRVALARALVTSPDLLLLDEPLSALDKKIRGEMQRELKRIHRETGLTTVMVTHDQEEAMDLGDRVLMLDEGAVQQHDTPEMLYREPQNRFVAQFLGGQLLGKGRVRGTGELARIEIGQLSLEASQHDLHDGQEVDVLVMAERVQILHPNDHSSTDAASGIIQTLDFFGPFARAEIDAHGLSVPVTMLSQEAEALAEGQRVQFIIAPAGLHAFAAHRV